MNANDLQILSNIKEPFTKVVHPNLVEPYRNLWNHMGVRRNLTEPYRTIWDLMETYSCPSEPYGILQKHTGVRRNLTEPYAWVLTETYACPSDPYGNLGERMETYGCVGTLWNLTGPYGNIQVSVRLSHLSLSRLRSFPSSRKDPLDSSLVCL